MKFLREKFEFRSLDQSPTSASRADSACAGHVQHYFTELRFYCEDCRMIFGETQTVCMPFFFKDQEHNMNHIKAKMFVVFARFSNYAYAHRSPGSRSLVQSTTTAPISDMSIRLPTKITHDTPSLLPPERQCHERVKHLSWLIIVSCAHQCCRTPSRLKNHSHSARRELLLCRRSPVDC